MRTVHCNDEACRLPEKRLLPKPNASKAWLLTLAAVILLLGGCTMIGPDMVKPEAPVMDNWQETEATGLRPGETDYSSWWRTFEDPVLDSLVEKAHQQNLNLQIAAIRIYEARAYLGIMVGKLYPQQQSAFGSIGNGDFETKICGLSSLNLGNEGQ